MRIQAERNREKGEKKKDSDNKEEEKEEMTAGFETGRKIMAERSKEQCLHEQTPMPAVYILNEYRTFWICKYYRVNLLKRR